MLLFHISIIQPAPRILLSFLPPAVFPQFAFIARSEFRAAEITAPPTHGTLLVVTANRDLE